MNRTEAISTSLTALINDKVEEAVAISSKYFGGAGSLYEKETVSVVRFILEHEYTPDPTIKPTVLKPLRVVAAAMELWGAGDVRDFADISGDWKYKYNPEIVTHLLYAAGLEQHRLQRLRDMGTKLVEIRTTDPDFSPSCRRDAGKVYPVDEVPILPHDMPGCQCSYVVARADTPAASGL